MNNVCFSFMELVSIMDELNMTICCPEIISKKQNWKIGDNIKIINNISELRLNEFDCVMTDVFISMNDNVSNEKKNNYLNIK